MSIVVATPTGHVGSAVSRRLLDAGQNVTLLARNASKLAGLAARGATVKTGTLEDVNYLIEATKGAAVLFWITPGDLTSPDLRALQNRLGQNAAAAVKANGIPWVVNLSSYVAHHGSGTGPVDGLHDVEQLLEGVAKNVLHLRPSFFMENHLNSRATIDAQGAIYSPIAGSTRVPMVATRDIAETAARRIVARDWTGRAVAGLHGPADLSFDEVAATIGEVLRKPVAHVKVPVDAVLQAMTGMGLSPDAARRMVELLQAAESGYLGRGAEPRTAQTTTPTTFLDFARSAFG